MKKPDEHQDGLADGDLDTGERIEGSLRGDRVLRKREIGRLLGLSLATVDRLRAAGDFPPAVRLSTRRIGWREIDIREWAANRKHGGLLTPPAPKQAASA
jgi:prophage regulatory protein